MLSSRYAAHVANPDRHGDLQHAIRLRSKEARAVVQLAVAIVQWDGAVRSLRMIMRRSGHGLRWLIELIEQRNVASQESPKSAHTRLLTCRAGDI
jgi:hypothetical protein